MKVACIFAHPDDETLACGGTIAVHSDKEDNISVLLMSDGPMAREKTTKNQDARNHAEKACDILGVNNLEILKLPDNEMDSLPIIELIKKIEKFIDEYQPQTIYTHHGGDLNIDHELICKAVLTACRPYFGQIVKEIYACEVNSSTEWSFNSKSLFVPNYFVDISSTITKKIRAFEEYKNEIRKFPHPRSIEGLKILSKYRGMQSGFNAAEAFMLLRNSRD
jgi:LmbE family N-acetylglucosaminyl deacetylase